MIWHGRDMARHCYGWEEITGAPLHEDALKGVGIVAYPELIKVREQSVVCSSSAGSAVLYYHVRILCPDSLQYLYQSLMVSDVEMALIIL